MRNKGKCRWLAAGLALLLCLGGCGKQPQDARDTVIIKVPTLAMNSLSNDLVDDANSFMELAVAKYVEAHPDLQADLMIEVFNYVDEPQAITQCYGTVNAVDVLYEGYFNMSGYINHGMLSPLDDIITEEMRADISESDWAQSKKDGKTYMLPYLSMQNILAYNKQIFRDCGLEAFVDDDPIIQNWSLEEWDYILDTMAEKLPEGSYPMFMYAGDNQGDTHIMTLLRSRGADIFNANGTFDFSKPQVLEAMEWLVSGVERGWYPPHSENMEMMDCQQLFQDGRLGVYVFNNANFTLYENANDDLGFVNFPGNLATSFITGFEVFDNGDPEKLAVAKDFVKFIYENEELMNLSAGNLPASARVAELYMDEIEMLPQFLENSSHVVDFLNGSNNWQGREDSVRSVFYPRIHELLAGFTTAEECAQRLNEDCNKALQVDTRALLEEETEKVAKRWQ